MDSSYIESDHSDSNLSTIPNSPTESQPQTKTTTSLSFQNSKYNKDNYTFNTSKIYIFENQLFTYTLLDINFNKDKEMLIKCTTYSFQKIKKVASFQSSNYTRHYKNKHPFIAYNKDSEKTRQKRSNLVKKTDTILDSLDKLDFFN